MAIKFQKVSRLGYLPPQVRNTAYLHPEDWDDFGHKTLFTLTVFDEQGNKQEIGNLKIGFIGQDREWTEEKIQQNFDVLPRNFYSLGQDADYYRNLVSKLSNQMTINVLTALGDVTHDPEHLSMAESENAFNISLMRNLNRSTIEHQFRRILRYEAPLTSYNFSYEKPPSERYSGIKVNFRVNPNSKPSSNIHILIGRNGVGKTTLLNNMVNALLPDRGDTKETGYFSTPSDFIGTTTLHEGYFSGVVSVAFSAFDPFTPPADQPNDSAGMRYYYIGLKKRVTLQGLDQWNLKEKNDLCIDFTESLKLCFALMAKRNRWINAVIKLESDFNFAEMSLRQLINDYDEDVSNEKFNFSKKAKKLFDRMSSGHAIVLLTITKLIETVEEKTLVLIDEPESHLHPPLLSAFTRALSDLLVNRNGVAIIATHSPVVLQEVPKSCVSILRRTRLVLNVDRPEGETFAENVGVLTREVFGLEVSKSGFHDLLAGSVDEGKNFEEIEEEYQHQLGFEGKAVLRSMITIKGLQEDN
ncbi:AAA family ATPase [Microbulbifer sp. JMSA003]|uniref:AAA family ATPase n=1 Tax=Microbulbifer sp. JMSA003 TaxID=3243369 RepID=UPI00403A0BC6